VTDALKSGDNQLEIVVANPWRNRIIGDQQRGAKKIGWTQIVPYVAGTDPLLPAGLLGPVQLIALK